MVKFNIICKVGTFYLSVKLRSSGFDISMGDAQIRQVPVEFSLELMAVVGSMF